MKPTESEGPRVKGVRWLAVLALWLSASVAVAEGPPTNAILISYDSDGQTLHGFLYKPDGPGPFPAVLWNHGSEERPGWQPELAKFYLEQGYVFFIPHRSGQGRSPGKYVEGDADPAVQVDILERHNRNVVTALAWLKTRPFIDDLRIVMSGASYGGIETLLTAEKGLGIRAFIPFAPGAMAWEFNPSLGTRLVTAVRNAKAPIFLIQASNDFSLKPSLVLGDELRTRGPPSHSTVYPPFGTTHLDGHGRFCCSRDGIAVWGSDVLKFLEQTNPPSCQ